MTDKLRILPPDPMEASQVPPDPIDNIEGRQDDPARHTRQTGQPDYVENEGLAGQTTREAIGTLGSRKGDELEEAAEAAQRGRTA